MSRSGPLIVILSLLVGSNPSVTKSPLCYTLDDGDHWKSNDCILMALEKKEVGK